MPTSRITNPENVEIEIQSVDGVTIVVLTGELDTNKSRAVQANVLPLVAARGKMIIDLSRVSYMSSAGLRFLLSLYRHTSNQDGVLILVGLADEIRETMEVTGFLDFFTACATMQDAMEKVGAVAE
ncbi:MAG: STAS domain-containing protein [Proteobacteria bacterium]|nr:STAS domain-containing protein [Pseudomonadota bacterium]